MKPLLSGHLFLVDADTKKVPEMVIYFLLLPTCIKWTLVIKFHHPTCQTPEMRKIATHNFFDFYIKKHDLTNLFDYFHSTVINFYFVLFV